MSTPHPPSQQSQKQGGCSWQCISTGSSSSRALWWNSCHNHCVFCCSGLRTRLCKFLSPLCQNHLPQGKIYGTISLIMLWFININSSGFYFFATPCPAAAAPEGLCQTCPLFTPYPRHPPPPSPPHTHSPSPAKEFRPSFPSPPPRMSISSLIYPYPARLSPLDSHWWEPARKKKNSRSQRWEGKVIFHRNSTGGNKWKIEALDWASACINQWLSRVWFMTGRLS